MELKKLKYLAFALTGQCQSYLIQLENGLLIVMEITQLLIYRFSQLRSKNYLFTNLSTYLDRMVMLN